MARKAKLDKNGTVSEPRERRRTSTAYIIFSLFVTLLGLAVTAGGILLYGQRQLEAAGPLVTAKTVVIEAGQRSAQIAAKLQGEGVIANEHVFYIASAIYRKLGVSLKAGEYRFEPGESMQAVFDKIAKGKGLAYKVTIPEGWTSMQALNRIREHPALTGDAPETLAEGVLLPDTYVFQRGETRQAVIERMRKAQAKLLANLWPKRAQDLPVTTTEELLILASIVEKETGVAPERARVAAVFLNRMKKKMRLQSDPTIIYGIVGGKGKLGRPIRRSEIDAKTAYNTYQIDGLPPTPIANPGKEAIAAVLQPEETDELFFVADGTGGHVFARTLAEHETNVRQYRKLERNKRQAAATAAKTQAAAEPQPAPAKAETAPPAKIAEQAEQPATAATVVPDTRTAAGDAIAGEIPVADSELPQSAVSSSGQVAQIPARQVPLPRRKPLVN